MLRSGISVRPCAPGSRADWRKTVQHMCGDMRKSRTGMTAASQGRRNLVQRGQRDANPMGTIMNEQLLLENIRSVLIRQEETIIFALLERAQFAVNACIYVPGAVGRGMEHESLVGYMLHETEKIHARVRRYTSPDEHPFYRDLPSPILEPLHFEENPLRPNNVNRNPDIREVYEQKIVPFICPAGDDAQYGSSSVCDVLCLQALSRRIHYGKFVAESKYQQDPESFDEVVEAGDATRIRLLITDDKVEERVRRRVAMKARTYGQDVDRGRNSYKIEPSRIVELYRRWIIPLTKEVEVAYLLSCDRS